MIRNNDDKGKKMMVTNKRNNVKKREQQHAPFKSTCASAIHRLASVMLSINTTCMYVCNVCVHVRVHVCVHVYQVSCIVHFVRKATE